MLHVARNAYRAQIKSLCRRNLLPCGRLAMKQSSMHQYDAKRSHKHRSFSDSIPDHIHVSTEKPLMRREQSLGWLSEDQNLVLEAMRKSLIHDLVDHNRESANQVVPWFLANMPRDYFEQLSKKIWYGHLRALNSLFEMKESPDLVLSSPCDNWITFIKAHNYSGLMNEMMAELPKKSPTLARMFTSKDCVLAINVFGYGQQELANEADINGRYWPSMEQYIVAKSNELMNDPLFSKEALVQYFKKCPKSYLNLCTPQRFIKQRRQYEKVLGTERVDVEVERNYLWHSREESDQKYALLSIATHNHNCRVSLENFASYMATLNLDIEFLYLDSIKEPGKQHVDMMTILLKDPESMTDMEWEQIRSDLERIKWVDNPALQAFERARVDKSGLNLTLTQAEIMSALCHMLYGQLNSGKWSISLEQMLLNAYDAYPDISIGIINLFERRFDPRSPMSEQEQKDVATQLRLRIQNVLDERIRSQLSKMLEVVAEARKTNLYIPERRGLVISVNPANLTTSKHTAGLPYGVFFVHGRRCNAFHVRFREHSRGGMRVATPGSFEDYTVRCINHYNEAYGLASTQHAKNKDIAEGGSKAVVIVRLNDNNYFNTRPQTHARRTQRNDGKVSSTEAATAQLDDNKRLIFRSVRIASDGILDMVCPSEELQRHIVAYGHRQEYVYLGPDEQITPQHINWITDHAKERKLPYATAFMSSKPKTGINHKQYGVTSEGVCIFLDVALRNIGKDPRSCPFTIKVTGGTSGDVAGNALKILHREYKDNAKVLGIVDHKASVEDPDGVDLSELLRLVNQDLSLEHYDCTKLSAGGALHIRDTLEGQVMCDSMHNRIESDAFLPAGGLPNTIRLDNWEAFLKTDGSPSSKLIVEAANIFIEQEARVKLTESGVLIVKDSSANKCGVICSAMEIMANLLLEEQEFLEFREEYVVDVLAHLRHLAKMEADVMFNEYKKTGGSLEGGWGHSLPGIAERISRVMNMSSDYISEQLPTILDMTDISKLAAAALLPSLRERAGNRLLQLPEGYLINMVAKYLSSQMVYHEGLDYVERSVPRNKFAQVSLQYFEETKRIEDMVNRISKVEGLDNREEILQLLRVGGPRVAVQNSKVFQPTSVNE